MTYLVENEQAALMVPARFLGRIHPHFREVIQFLATQLADEARHVEVFTRRASLAGHDLGVSGAGGRASLQTLLDEPDWATASFLLSVLGEGTFLSLLSFLERYAPDPVDRRGRPPGPAGRGPPRRLRPGPPGRARGRRPDLPRPAPRRDRAPPRRPRRHARASATSVHDALVVLAAGAWDPRGDRHRLAAGAGSASATWTRAGAGAWCDSVSATNMPATCQPSIPATSCS